jgi:hypothetical protein
VCRFPFGCTLVKRVGNRHVPIHMCSYRYTLLYVCHTDGIIHVHVYIHTVHTCTHDTNMQILYRYIDAEGQYIKRWISLHGQKPLQPISQLAKVLLKNEVHIWYSKASGIRKVSNPLLDIGHIGIVLLVQPRLVYLCLAMASDFGIGQYV